MGSVGVLSRPDFVLRDFVLIPLIGIVRRWISKAAATFGIQKLLEMGINLRGHLITDTGKFFNNAYMMRQYAPKVLKGYIAER